MTWKKYAGTTCVVRLSVKCVTIDDDAASSVRQLCRDATHGESSVKQRAQHNANA